MRNINKSRLTTGLAYLRVHDGSLREVLNFNEAKLEQTLGWTRKIHLKYDLKNVAYLISWCVSWLRHHIIISSSLFHSLAFLHASSSLRNMCLDKISNTGFDSFRSLMKGGKDIIVSLHLIKRKQKTLNRFALFLEVILYAVDQNDGSWFFCWQKC